MKHEESMKLFYDRDNKWITYKDVVESLKNVEANQCDILLLHTGISFGLPAKGLKREELVKILYDAITELNVQTLVFPTFTFSFPNKEVYDIKNSKTKMGMLNEYVRKLPEAIRTKDPLLSFCVVGENKKLVEVHGNKSLGKGSFFDNLHRENNVKIAFFGADLTKCNTYQHYVEETLRVPYRYDKEFFGKVIDENGQISQEKYILYVKYRDVIPFTPSEFEEELLKKGYYKKVSLGNSCVSCLSEKDAYRETKGWIEKDVNAFLKEPYDNKPLVKEYQYGNVITV